ncbi:unnamed protein product [Caenorhabditis bovis]|uniref:Transmembrane protein 135 N-terminal domain-containing protein n=1 Tax=Caenorhabditis bovis TaxID=2654633 RepID=A0A8S1ENN7_9PELO|nr:unnamed protein product [Caenorhabditis bovis]
MGNLSKLAIALGQPVLHANCYETIHTWNPDCYGAIWVTNIIQKRGRLDKVKWDKFIKDVVRSSLFLTTNMIFFLFILCKLRQLLGFFTPVSLGLLSSIAASGIAIFVEKKTRRPALALYLTNLASETFYRHLTLHGKAPHFKYGECVPFGIGLMIFSFLQASGRLPKSFNGFMNIILKSNISENIVNTKNLPNDFKEFLEKLRADYDKTVYCQHPHSCISQSVESFGKNFSTGLIISTALHFVKNGTRIISNPLKVISTIISKNNMRLPLFAGLLPLLFNASRCLMNRHTMIPNTMNNTISAGIASLAMIAFPNVSIAMYFLWKAIETVYFHLVNNGYIPKIKNGEAYLYAVMTGYVLWNCIIEPSAIRKGYLGFLQSLVGGRLNNFNRRLYDHFGYFHRDICDGMPLLDTRYVTINPLLYQPLVK